MEDVKRTERAKEDALEQSKKEKVKPKDKPSDFDKAIEQQRLLQKASLPNLAQKETATKEGIKELMKREEEKAFREPETRREEKASDKSKSEKKADAKEADQRVVGRGSATEGGGGGGGGSQKDFGQREQSSKKGLEDKLMQAGAKGVPVDLRARFAEKVQASVGKEAPKLSQEILNQLIKFVKIGLNEQGEKEILIDLHEKIFKGLKLRVTAMEKGKVLVHFMAADAETRGVFERGRSEIKQALVKKGIDVEDVMIS